MNNHLRTLSEEPIDVYLMTLSPMFVYEDKHYNLLSSDEKKRADRFKFPIHRKRFIAAHAGTRIILSNYLESSAKELIFNKHDLGKPYLEMAQLEHTKTLYFNLSHTEDSAILAVSCHAELGIDIECQQRNTHWQGICQRFFSTLEQKTINTLPQNQQKQAFFDLWTRKEAYMKVLGTGLSLAPDSFSISVHPAKPELLEHRSKKHPRLSQVAFSTIKLPEKLTDYYATLAVASEQCNYKIFEFS